jgi:exosortase
VPAIPLPAFVVNSLTIQLQLLASSSASRMLALLSVPVYQDGNVLQIRGMALGVAEACSGLRSLYAVAIVSLVLGLSFYRTSLSRLFLRALAIPLAIVMNIVRITARALIAGYRPELAAEFFHTCSGVLIFGVECGLLILMTNALAHVLVQR